MIQELIYTSAPQGLRAGASGYCTVAMTHGISPALVDQLETLSGYRHVFQPGDPAAASNPINHSFLKITVGGARLSVLSRVADAGFDHTHRTNKLAHHLVLDALEVEKCPAGPAAALAVPKFMYEVWREEPRHLTPPQKPFPQAPPLRICHTWKQLTGDAGYAGVLADNAVRRSSQDLCILFEPGMPLLTLVVEAMSLLSPQERWNTTFSTYYTKLPPGVECRWRFILAGSAEAKLAARMPNVRTIPLGGVLPQADGGEWSEAARSGIPVRRSTEPTPTTTGTVVSFAQPKQAPLLTLDEESSNSGGSYGVGPPPTRKAAPMQAATVPQASPFSIYGKGNYSTRPSWQFPALVAVSMALLALSVVLLVKIATKSNPKLQIVQQLEEEGKLNPPAAAPSPTASPTASPSATAEVKPDKPAADPVPTATAEVKPPPPAPKETSTPPPQQTVQSNTSPDQAFKDLEQRGFYLELPKSTSGKLDAASGSDLCRIAIKPDGNCTLTLVGGNSAFGEKKLVTLTPEPTTNPFVQSWVLNFEATGGLLGKQKPKPFARLGLVKQTGILRFEWEPSSSMPAGVKDDTAALNFCLLQVKVGDRTEFCQLVKTQLLPPIRLAVKGAVATNFAQIEFAEKDSTASVPLSTSGEVVAVSASNSYLTVVFKPSAAVQPAPTPLPAPRKGLRFDLSTEQIPCFVELELCDLPNGPAKTLGVSASVSYQGYRYEPNPKLVRVDQPEPFNRVAYDTAITAFDGRLTKHKDDLAVMTGPRNAADGEVKRLMRILNTAPPGDPQGKAALELQKRDANEKLPAARAQLTIAQNALDANKKFAILTTFVQEVPQVVRAYQELANKLVQFQNSTQFDYEISLEYPERSIKLLKSTGP